MPLMREKALYIKFIVKLIRLASICEDIYQLKNQSEVGGRPSRGNKALKERNKVRTDANRF